jgi:hypothetical protein
VAGLRVLRAERRLLETWVGSDADHPRLLLGAMVAVHGRGALELLCSRYVPVGSLAPVREPVAVPALAPRRLVLVHSEVWEHHEAREVYAPVSAGPAIRVRPAFADRVAA